MPAKKATAKKADKKESGTFSFNELFGVSSKRADEIISAFKHAQLDHDNWQGVLKQVQETVNLQGDGEHVYFGYVYGRLYEKHNSSPMSFLEHLLNH